MRVERFAMAYRFFIIYALVRPESEQNSSHLQIDCDRWLAIMLVGMKVSAQAPCVRRAKLGSRKIEQFYTDGSPPSGLA